MSWKEDSRSPKKRGFVSCVRCIKALVHFASREDITPRNCPVKSRISLHTHVSARYQIKSERYLTHIWRVCSEPSAKNAMSLLDQINEIVQSYLHSLLGHGPRIESSYRAKFLAAVVFDTLALSVVGQSGHVPRGSCSQQELTEGRQY